MSQNSNSSSAKAKDTLLDRLYDSYIDEEAEESLTESEKKKRSIIEAAWSLLVNYHSFEQSLPLLMSRFDISRATAYRMLNNATRLFGDVTQTNKQGLRHILYEYSMKVFQLAATMKPPDLKQMNTAIKNMAMLKGLNSDDTSAFDAELLQAHTYLIQIASGAEKAPSRWMSPKFRRFRRQSTWRWWTRWSLWAWVMRM